MWLRHDDCLKVVEEAWFCSEGNGDAMGSLMDKLTGGSEGLKYWNKNTFGNIHW